MITLIVAALLRTNALDGGTTWQPDVSRLADGQSYTLRGAKLQDAPRRVSGVTRALCGRTDYRRRSGPHRFVYVETADGSLPLIFQENDPPKLRERFGQLWRDLDCH
jgi:hypothetical protein